HSLHPRTLPSSPTRRSSDLIGHDHLDQFIHAVPHVPGDRPAAGIADRQPDPVQQLVGHPRPACHRHTDQSRRAYVLWRWRERQVDCGHHPSGDVAVVAASTESCKVNTRSSAVIRKTFSSFSLSQTSASRPPASFNRFSAPTSTPRPVESRKSTRLRSTTTLLAPPSIVASSRSRRAPAV